VDAGVSIACSIPLILRVMFMVTPVEDGELLDSGFQFLKVVENIGVQIKLARFRF